MLGALKYDACEYRRREPEQDLLHRVLVEYLETFLDRTRTEELGLPKHVTNELRDYVKCGVLAHGFVRVRCNDCFAIKTHRLLLELSYLLASDLRQYTKAFKKRHT